MTRGGVAIAGHVIAFLDACKAASGPVPDSTIIDLVTSRLPPRTTARVRDVVIRDVMQGSHDSPKSHQKLINVARSMLRFAGVISDIWLKRHPSRALVAVRRMMLETDDAIILAEKEGRKRRPKRFPLLPIFAMKRQWITIDKDTLLMMCKKANLLKKGTNVDVLTLDYRRSLFRVPKDFPFTENTSIESDGVGVVLRICKESVMVAPKLATVSDLESLSYSRVICNDPGRRQIATTVEWKRGSEDKWEIQPGSQRMTRDEYYDQAGINTRMAKRQRRDVTIADEMLVLKGASLKTASSQTFESSLLARMEVVEALWTHKLGRWTSIADMSGFAARRRTLDRFWRNKVGLEASPENSTTVVVFGDGKFSASGKNERAVPRKAM
jgi:hypothetical protein